MSTSSVAISSSFPEMDELKAIRVAGGARFAWYTIGEVRAREHMFPILTAAIGSDDPQAPAIGFFGGVHGLECIGTQLVLEYMRALLHGSNGTTRCIINCARCGSSSCRSSIPAACSRAPARIRMASI